MNLRTVACVQAVVVVVLVGCGPAEPTLQEREPVRVTTDQLVGVPKDGYPNYQEQVMLVAINRARSAPNVDDKTSSSCSTSRTAQPPLMYNFASSRAARFHGDNSFINHGSLSHSSYCTLRSNIGTTYGSTCDGNKSCACVAGTDHFSCTVQGGHGTDPFDRADLFGFDLASEVLAAGPADGWDAVWLWMSECPNSPSGEGHRLALTSVHNEIGLGYVGTSSCNVSRYYGGDIGDNAPSMYELPAGIHHPRTGTAFDFYVNYYDNAGAPKAVKLVVDGACSAMSLDLGTQKNGTYKASKTVSNACHQYWFLAYTASGERRVYPEKGAWGVGNCVDYKATATPAACEDCLPGETDPCGVGQCKGTRTCALGAWKACNGPAPSAEVCDGVDNNCDGNLPANEADGDGDGYMVCEKDCNDNNAKIHPGAAEGCNGVDNDCDGKPAANEADKDGDGYMICEQDCDDGDAKIHPGATEICNGVDDDCDSTVDEGCPCGPGEAKPCGVNQGICVKGTQTCNAGAWGACEGGVSPADDDVCGNGLDDNCDGEIDEGCILADSGTEAGAGGDASTDVAKTDGSDARADGLVADGADDRPMQMEPTLAPTA